MRCPLHSQVLHSVGAAHAGALRPTEAASSKAVAVELEALGLLAIALLVAAGQTSASSES